MNVAIEKQPTLLKFQVCQVLYLDNLTCYMVNTDQFILPHELSSVTQHPVHLGVLKSSLLGSVHPSKLPPGGTPGPLRTGTSLPSCSDFPLLPVTHPPPQTAKLHHL